jgi:hypothetical protein
MMRAVGLTIALVAGCAFDTSGVGSGSFDAAPDAPTDGPVPDAFSPAMSCSALHQASPSLPSGVYSLGSGADAGSDLMTYCEMDTMGGGWSLLMRTVWDFGDSMQLMTPYAALYAQTIGSPMPKHAFRLAASLWPTLAEGHQHLLVVYLRLTNGDVCRPLYYAATATWTISPTGGAVSNIATTVPIFNNATQLSAMDQGPAQTCISQYSLVPWVYASCCSTCFTLNSFTSPHPAVDFVNSPDVFGHTISDLCPSAPPPVVSGTYYGADVMEYYVR